ncbi:uncharacterized protein LOC128187182 [Crassostrea angulata]|uniref:uncharacterized protein LOC128187182 n=1 Tax=Magallana angulata TaxID=2784310 RepID=UPI0022B1A865|nr:uncharacterized protein LOC128187182 [Crassostrea angulata]
MIKPRVIIRFLCLGIFLFSTFSITISWRSLITFAVFLASLYILSPAKQPNASSESDQKTTRQIVNELYPLVDEEELQRSVERAVFGFVTYDATSVTALQQFNPVQENTECIFAKKAKLWGNQDWNQELSLEENVFRWLPTLLQFTIVCRQYKLDGFVIEIPEEYHHNDIHEFAKTFKKILKVISDNDPKNIKCMDKSYVSKRGWVFQFNKMTFFITTFAPFYPATNSRYAFGCDNCFILLQPELSFALHDLSWDTPETNYDNPTSERDRIRCAYRDAGRPYVVPRDITQPMAWDMIKPLTEHDPIVQWWK